MLIAIMKQNDPERFERLKDDSVKVFLGDPVVFDWPDRRLLEATAFAVAMRNASDMMGFELPKIEKSD